MKKTIAFILSTVLLLCAVVPMSVSAATPDDYSENLMAYWNFESYRPLNDKATGGKEANALTANGNVEYTKGGVATIGTAKTDYFDVNNQTGKDVGQSAALTLGFKVKLTYKSGGGNTFLITKTNGFSVFAVPTSDRSGFELFWANDGLHNEVNCKCDIFGDTVLSYGQTYYIFIVVEAAVTAPETPVNNVTGYYSTDGKNFTAATTLTNTQHKYVKANGTRVCEDGYVFGSYANKGNFFLGNNAKSAEIEFDDVWYFNTAVAAESLSTIALHKMNSAGNTGTESPAYRGCQMSAVTSGKFNTRFVGTVNSTDYKEVGFEITVTNYNGQAGDMVVYDTDTVYSSIIGNSTVGGAVTYTAAELDGTYIYALSVNNISTAHPVTFLVTPYHIEVGGTSRIQGTSYEVTVYNGNVVSQLVYTAQSAE